MTKAFASCPDVFVIGAMKAGTSTLWKDMFNAPELSPSKTKELNYFLKNDSIENLDRLYRSQFESESKIKIDISPNYSRRHIFEGVASRIHSARPDAKIVYLVRNPIDRIISHLHHDLFRDRINPGEVEKALFENHDYISTSQYFYQIEPYIQLFGLGQILVLPIELLKHDSTQFVNRIKAFLRVKDFSLAGKSYNISEKRYRIKYHDPVHAALSNSYLLKLYHYFWYIINLKVERPTLSREVVDRINKEIANDKEKMIMTFGVEIGKWM